MHKTLSTGPAQGATPQGKAASNSVATHATGHTGVSSGGGGT